MSSHDARHVRRILASCLILTLVFADWTPASETPMTTEFMLAEYPKGLAKLEEQFKHCNGEAIFSTSAMSDKGALRLISGAKVKFAFSGPNGMLEQTADIPEPTKSTPVPPPKNQKKVERDYESILFFNQNYSCRLSKRTRDADFLIRWITPDPATAEKEIARGPGHFVRCPMTADLFPVSTLLKIAGFRVEKITPIEAAGQARRVRIDFTIPKRADAKPNANQITAGWLLVSPESDWALYDYGIVLTTPGSTKLTRVGHVEYDRESTGKLKAASSQHRTYLGEFSSDPASSVPPAVPRVIEDFRFTGLRFGDMPDRDFTLSGFGLPEFGQTVAQAASSRRYPWWILGSAIVLAVIALLLRRFSSRHPIVSGKIQPTS